MCGILTCISKRGGLSEKVSGALALMRHRGPDSQNMYLWGNGKRLMLKGDRSLAQAETAEFKRYEIAMGHARLSIIDPSEASSQPMVSEDGTQVFSFNGEIYNYLELRKGLESRGMSLRTQSDSEVLLKCLTADGTGKLKEMNGMWAFSLLDLKRKKLLIARDRYGKKPLFYYNGEDYFIAASEIKAIFHILNTRRALSADFLTSFISFNYWPSFDDGGTLYKEIRLLRAGCVLAYDINSGKIEMTDETSIHDSIGEPVLTARDLPEELESAVKLRLRADVPLGVLVSGGVDSSMIAAHAVRSGAGRDIAWYAGDTGSGNDARYAELLAASLGVSLNKIDIRLDIGTKLAEKLTYSYEKPLLFLGNSIAMFQIYQHVAADGIKVVLDGTGGDEVFGGYFDHYNSGILNSFLEAKDAMGLVEFIYASVQCRNIGVKKMFRDLLFGFLLPLEAESAGCQRKYRRLGGGFSYEPGNGPSGGNRRHNLAQMQRYDIVKGRLPNWLHMNDQNSMVNSVEVRSPLLDYRLAKYINLPVNSKYANGFNKVELRKAIPEYLVPDAVRWRRDKQGFRWSPSNYIKANLPELRETILSSAIVSRFFEKDRLASRLDALLRNDSGFFLRLYSVALLEKIFDCSL